MNFGFVFRMLLYPVYHGFGAENCNNQTVHLHHNIVKFLFSLFVNLVICLKLEIVCLLLVLSHLFNSGFGCCVGCISLWWVHCLGYFQSWFNSFKIHSLALSQWLDHIVALPKIFLYSLEYCFSDCWFRCILGVSISVRVVFQFFCFGLVGFGSISPSISFLGAKSAPSSTRSASGLGVILSASSTHIVVI